MPTEPRWGSAAIDLSARDLPALKLSYLVRHAPATGTLLELGSGEGKVLRTIARERPGLRLIGCDVRDVPPADGAYEFRRVREGALPAADGEVDAVVLADVLEHLPEPGRTLDEIRRVLKPSGTLVAFVPLEGERFSAYALYRRLLGADLYRRTKEHEQAFTHAEARALVGERFELLDEEFLYHALGQWLDASFFAAASLPRVGRFWWRENRYYNFVPSPRPFARALNVLLGLGNRLAFAESQLLARWPWLSAGWLFAARRP